MSKNYADAPRLYVEAPLREGQPVTLEAAQTHYLRNVMRLGEGQSVRLFNGRDGEFAALIETLSKKEAVLCPIECLRLQPEQGSSIHLLFAPLKKHRMDQVIEKTVELGVTDLHPVITAHTEVRSLNKERILAQITEAAEQSGRLEVPKLHPIMDLQRKMAVWKDSDKIFWAAESEKDRALPLSQALQASAFLVGPVGGFSQYECEYLASLSFIKPVSLGPRVLRAETAAIYCIVLAKT